MLRVMIAILILLGVAAALIRGYDTARFITTNDVDASGLSPLDRQNIEQMAGAFRIDKGSPGYRELEVETAEYVRRFNVHPLMTFLHVLAGSLVLILGALQFSPRIRSRYLRFHRWSGRVLLIAAIGVGWSAFFFGLLIPYGGLSESLAITGFGGLFVFTAARAYLAIRRGDVAHHREWMIRMYSLALGISTIRIINLVLLAIRKGAFRESFVLSLWIGWTLTLFIGELWIRHTRKQTVVMKARHDQATDRRMATWVS